MKTAEEAPPTTLHFRAQLPSMSAEEREKFSTWHARTLAQSVLTQRDDPVLFGQLKRPATVNRIQQLLRSGLRTRSVSHEGYHRGWVVPLTEDEFRGCLAQQNDSKAQFAHPGPPALRALARDLVCTHKQALQQSIELRKELLAFLKTVEAPASKRARVEEAIPLFPRVGLTVLDVARDPEASLLHGDSELCGAFPPGDGPVVLARVEEILEEQSKLLEQRQSAAAGVAPFAPTLR